MRIRAIKKTIIQNGPLSDVLISSLIVDILCAIISYKRCHGHRLFQTYSVKCLSGLRPLDWLRSWTAVCRNTVITGSNVNFLLILLQNGATLLAEEVYWRNTLKAFHLSKDLIEKWVLVNYIFVCFGT